MTPPLVEFDAVVRRRGGHAVLQGFSFSLARGEVYGLLGPNGCGKSTALNILAGLLQADAGRVLFDGRPVDAQTQRRIGLCPQQVALYRELKPAENLDFYARLHGLPAAQRKQRVDELMQRFDLQAHAGTPAGQLSGGWQQRLNLAVALVHGPELLILDEPSSAVDVQARHALWSLIDGLRAGGMSILLSTHHMAEAERLCTRVGLMQGGRIAAEGTLAQLLARVPAMAVASIKAPDPAAARARAQQLGWGVRDWGGQAAFLLPTAATVREVVAALDGLDISAVSVGPVTLEHAYLELLGGGP